MPADNRTVTTDALETLGTIITENEKRDAIHLAVEPVRATTILRPGQDVNAQGRPERPYVGIVDPFLKGLVSPGQRFWLVIYPRQINSLRHVWTHPSFQDIVEEPKQFSKEIAESKLRAICESWDGPNYEKFISLVQSGETNDAEGEYGYSIEGEYIYSYGRDASGEIPPEVWDYAEAIVGKKIDSRPQWFSCSC